jgi:outer membrane immunogenic protein
MMKQSIVAAAAALLFATGSAVAADFPTKAPYYKAPPAYYGWTGCYVGVQGGFGSMRSNNSFSSSGSPPFIAEENTNGDGGIFGGHLGCTYQYNQWVVGLEGDGEWTGIKGNDGGSHGDVNELSARWLASVRGRLGVTFGSSLLYATGGLAFMGARSSVLDPGEQEAIRRTITGWTIGAGWEYAFAPNFSTRVEYRYTDFGTEGFVFPVNGYTERHNDIRIHAVRVGLTYRFGGWRYW